MLATYSEADHKILGRGQRLLQITSGQQECGQASRPNKGKQGKRGSGERELLVILLPPVALLPSYPVPLLSCCPLTLFPYSPVLEEASELSLPNHRNGSQLGFFSLTTGFETRIIS